MSRRGSQVPIVRGRVKLSGVPPTTVVRGMRDVRDGENAIRKQRLVQEGTRVALGGAVIYVCVPDEAFPNGDVSRLGVLFVVPDKSDEVGDVPVRVFAHRLASRKRGEAFKLEAEPVGFSGSGRLTVDEELTYVYNWNDPNVPEIGVSDRLIPVNQDGILVWKGRFTGKCGDKVVVTGHVQHAYWSDADAFLNKVARKDDFKIPRIDPQFWRVMQPGEIGSWGRRMYDLLPESEKATEANPYVLVDITSGLHEHASPETEFDVLCRMRKTNPGGQIYCAEGGATPSIQMGV